MLTPDSKILRSELNNLIDSGRLSCLSVSCIQLTGWNRFDLAHRIECATKKLGVYGFVLL